MLLPLESLIKNGLFWLPGVFAVTLLIFRWQTIASTAIDWLSFLINWYLCWKYPIKSSDGKYSLPTCPYRWPNGQGDVSKFLEGIQNSATWGKQYGKIYRIWSGMNSEVVLTQQSDLRIIFKDSDKHIKAKNNDAGWLMGEILGKCVGLVSGKDWQTLKTITEIPFLHKNVMVRIPVIEQRIKQHFEQLRVKQSFQEGRLNPVNDFKMLPFWVVADTLYGNLTSDMELQLLELIPIRESLFSDMIRGGLPRFAWSRFLPSKTNRKLHIFKTKWALFNDIAFSHATAFVPNADIPIVHMYRAIEDGIVTREQLLQTLDEMLFANLDVTIGALSWNLVFLAAEREWQDSLREEILAKRSSSTLDKYLADPSTLLAASINESSRLKPLAAFSVPQAIPTHREVGGFIIPAGTNIVIDSYAINIHSSFWGSNSQSYDPSRFLQKSSTDMRYAFWRFGFGPRTCIGKYVADVIIRNLLVHLLENFELSLLGDAREWNRKLETWITHPDTDVQCKNR